MFAAFRKNQTSPVSIIAIEDLVFTRPNNATAIEIVPTDDRIFDCLIIYRHGECENIVLFSQYHTDAVSAIFLLTLIYFFLHLRPSPFYTRLDKQYSTTLAIIIIEPRALSETHFVPPVYIYIYKCVCIHRYIAPPFICTTRIFCWGVGNYFRPIVSALPTAHQLADTIPI